MDKESIRKYGIKGTTLRYISDNIPEIPIEPFVSVGVDEDWKQYKSEIDSLGDYCLVRSSSPLEDCGRVSFAGLFETVLFNGRRSVEDVLNSISYDNVKKYADIYGIAEEIKMGLVFQKRSESDMNWGMLRHPHLENLIFIQGRPTEGFSGLSRDYVYNEDSKKIYELQFLRDRSLFSGNETHLEYTDEDFPAAIDAYKKIEALPDFQTGFTYHMEFGSDPFSVYQFRAFRKKEQANWKLKTSKEFKARLEEFPLSFGITPEKGLELNVVRALSPHENKLINHRRKLREAPKEIIINKLMNLRTFRSKKRVLNIRERAYAEEIAELDPDTWGSSEYEALDKALSRLNVNADLENTCLMQENIHFYYGEDIDLVFPNAKCWIPSGALQFLSHNLFRAMQHYDIALTGHYNLHCRTGDKVRVYSDGRKGKIEYLKK